MNAIRSYLTPEQIALLVIMAVALLLLYGGSSLPKLSRLVSSIFTLNTVTRRTAFIEIAGIRFTDDDRKRHTHILGATGSGKTVLIEHLLYRDLVRGYGAIIIDAKGERELFDKVAHYCARIGRKNDLRYLSATYSNESFRWNPCRLGNPSELQSKFFGSAKHENSFYAKACELALLQVFNRVGHSKPNQR